MRQGRDKGRANRRLWNVARIVGSTTPAGRQYAGAGRHTPGRQSGDHCAGSHIYIKQWQTATDKQTDGCGVAAAAGG